jgi:hypothetical protein
MNNLYCMLHLQQPWQCAETLLVCIRPSPATPQKWIWKERRAQKNENGGERMHRNPPLRSRIKAASLSSVDVFASCWSSACKKKADGLIQYQSLNVIFWHASYQHHQLPYHLSIYISYMQLIHVIYHIILHSIKI